MSSTATDRSPFQLEVTEQEQAKIFHLKGRLMDQQQADKLMEVLEGHLGQKPEQQVVLDLAELLYMNSTGLNIMITMLTRTRKAGGKVVLAAMAPGVAQLFTVTKLDTVFPITDTVEEALAELRK